jgi:hypothetical protein
VAARILAQSDGYTDAPCSKPASVAFAKGANSATYNGGFERDAMDCWTVVAKQGQTLTVKIAAADENASFDIYQPKYEIKKGAEGLDVQGQPLTPGGQGDRHIDHWSGPLPSSGRYLINILSEGGNVTYELTVSVK